MTLISKTRTIGIWEGGFGGYNISKNLFFLKFLPENLYKTLNSVKTYSSHTIF